jgi:4-amino-4-deoxy-L-arabinose transferase-like glycosyltransferase
VRRSWLALALAIFAVMLVFRLCHAGVIWVDEAYGLSAAARLLQGDVLYRDVWFDKPPLYAWVHLLCGARAGWPVRVLGAAFATLCCLLAGGLARRLWGAAEARSAALLACFFLIFGHPVATVSLAPDLLTLPFALAGVWTAVSGRGLAAGLLAGAALLANAKAFFLLPVIVVCHPRGWRKLAAGFAAAAAAGLGLLAAQGALPGYLEQVWRWGALYSADPPFASPVWEGLRRTANWAGFHIALLAGAAVYWSRCRDRTAALLAVWLLAGLVAVAAGGRFYPRYYFALLPVLALAAARGYRMLAPRARLALLALALALPLVRFGPRQLALAYDTARGQPHGWSDLAMFDDCRAAAALLRRHARPGGTLFVWGYRPELQVLARMPAATRFLDSQPLTGVFADRHLARSRASAAEVALRNRKELRAARPAFVVDGLGPYNPALAITAFPDLRAWMAEYEIVGATAGTRIYRRSGTP